MEKSEKYAFIEGIWSRIEEVLDFDSDDSDKEDILLGLSDLGKRATMLRTGRRNRQWVKEWRKQKAVKGSFAFLNKELLLQDEASYRNYLRMTKPQFDFLLSLVAQEIQRSDTQMREAIPAEEKLAITLRFLATGESFVSLDYQTRLSKSSISGIIPEVCSVLYKHLKAKYLKFPSNDLEWQAIAQEFAIKWQFQNCLGALDGKHVTFRSSRKDGAFYHNYKGTNSIILLALVDANCKFIFVEVGCNGRTNDAGVYIQSKLSNILQEEKEIPKPSLIGNNRLLPYVVVGDDAFPLQTHLMKPYPYHSQCQKKQTLNNRLSRARHVVEHAFGIYSNRFRVFLAPINLGVETVQKIVLACCALHNYLIDSGETYVESVDRTNNFNDARPSVSQNPYNPRKGEAENIRQQFMSYFNEEGKLDW